MKTARITYVGSHDVSIYPPFFCISCAFLVFHDADGVHRDPTNPSQPVGCLGRTWGSGQGRGKMQEGQVPTSFLPPIWARCFWRPDFLLIPKFYLVQRLSLLLLLLLSQKVNTHAIPSMPGVTEAPKALVTAMAWWYTPVGQPQCRWTLVSQMAENEREPTMFWSKKSCCGLYSITCILCLIWSKESTKKTRDWQESTWVPNFLCEQTCLPRSQGCCLGLAWGSRTSWQPPYFWSGIFRCQPLHGGYYYFY